MTDTSSTPSQRSNPPEIDATVPHSARIWNYWLGGKDNYPVDREVGDEYRAVYPEIVEVARASGQFLARAVRYLAGEAGIRQFLDIGTGLPTVDNTHEVAQRVAPESQDRLRRQRPAGAGPCPRPAHQHPEGGHRLRRRRPARPRRDPGRRRPDPGLHQADRADDAGDPGPHRRRRRGPVDREAAPGRPAVGQLPDDLRRDQRPLRGGCGGPAALQRERRGPLSAPQRASRSPSSSRAWSSWSPAWCRAPGGGPTPSTSAATSPPRWTRSPASAASRNRRPTSASRDPGIPVHGPVGSVSWGDRRATP